MATNKNYNNIDMNKFRKHPNYILFVSILAILAIGLWLTSVNLYQQKKEREEIAAVPVTDSAVVPQVSPAIAQTQGITELKAESKKVATGQSVQVTVSLDSDKKDVVGYDVLLKYDPDAVDFVSATSLSPLFSVVPVAKNGVVSVTGYKGLQVKDATVFSNTPVLRFVFTAKQKGTYNFTVLPSFGKQKTRIVDVDLNRLSPRTSTLEVEIN